MDEKREIWIPSKAAMQRTLTEDCIAYLKKIESSEEMATAFITWVNANAGVLSWIGEQRREQLIIDVAMACGLEGTVDY